MEKSACVLFVVYALTICAGFLTGYALMRLLKTTEPFAQLYSEQRLTLDQIDFWLKISVLQIIYLSAVCGAIACGVFVNVVLSWCPQKKDDDDAVEQCETAQTIVIGVPTTEYQQLV